MPFPYEFPINWGWPLSVPRVAVSISGEFLPRLKGSLSIRNAIGRRSTASFVIVDKLGDWSFERGQKVEIVKPGFPPFVKLLFGGVIDKPSMVRMPASSIIYHHLDCIDWHYLADKRRAAESYTSETAKAIVEDLHTKYLEPEGVTIGEVQTGPTIEEMVINYQTVSKALDALANSAGFIWYIDEHKRLFFVVRTTTDAPFNIDAHDINKLSGGGSSKLSRDSHSYRNRQYIRAGRDVTALQTETFTGDGVTQAFAVSFPINQVPTVTVAGAPQTIGIKGIDTTKDCYWSKGDPILAFDNASIPGAVAIVIQYYGEYDIMVLAEDTPEINARKAIEGGTGIVEAIDDEPALNSKQAAFDVALATLEHYGIIGKQFRFAINTWGLAPGQIVTVDYPEYGLSSAELLIESVDVSEFAPGTLTFTILAIEGPETGDWTGFFGALAGMKDEVLGRLNVGSNQVLIILAQFTGNVEVSGPITKTIFACPLIDSALVDTAIVC